MLVARHKRSKDGPAILPMLADMQEYMATYIDVIRPKFALKDEQKIFVTTEGRGFREGTIGRRISSFCEKAGIRLQDRLAAVNWRKLVSTATKEKATPQEAELVRKVMAHSEQTANRSYIRRKLTKVGAEAVKIIARVTAPGEEQPKKEEAQENPHDAPGTSGIEASALPAEPCVSGFSSAPSTAKSLLSPSDCSVAVLTTSTNVVPPTPPPSFNQKQKEAIERVFNDEVTTGKKTTIEEAQKKCCTTAILSSFLMTKRRVKQVVNYVNYQVQKKISASPQDLPAATSSKVDSWLFDVDDPSTRSSGQREHWDEADTALLKRKFLKEDSCPRTTIIRAMCAQDNDLHQILEREGWERFYTKIKNMFKKKKRDARR